MSSLNMATLLPLLPLLASLPSALASPYRYVGGEELRKRATTNTTTPLGFEQVSASMGISAQMMFLGNTEKVYVLDKTENNPATVTGPWGTHPAWAVEYDLATNDYRTMDVLSNTFCAGGSVLGNGTWVVFGGNKPITTGGKDNVGSAGAYSDEDGGSAIRMMDPCTDESCDWQQPNIGNFNLTSSAGGYLLMTSKRWYPTVETLEDGSVIVIGGDINGGYVNDVYQDNPTYEFFPHKGTDEPIHLQWLADTLPINLYPLTWLMPDGQLFMQANRSTILYNWKNQTTTQLPAMPYAARVYPASAATAMLPLTPENNYTPTVLFCGGSNPPQWGDGIAGYNVTAVQADNTCVRINPMDENPEYITDDYMFEGRSMGEFVILPDGNLWMGNGVGYGTAGYGSDKWSIGMSYGQEPVYMPALYNPNAPAGGRWNRTGLTASSAERMYHSSAILLPDSSVFVSGSNPNADFTTEQWPSRTDAEKWYPWYYNEPRPTLPSSAPTSLSYGGDAFNVTLDTYDQTAVESAHVVIIRGGFHTHAIGFGQRSLTLNSTYTVNQNTNTSMLHVAQMPNNPALFQPGPAMMFLVVNGVPSMANWIMVGNGQLGDQPTSPNADLPASSYVALNTSSSGGSSGSGSDSSGSRNKDGGAMAFAKASPVSVGLLVAAVGSLLALA
ncbi:putative glyoxal oxidase precursor [Kockovaella imperatae]|uniref:Putative glyoxal oxidase n=1 Tax=Kockovaella imperatae TaxID=4999 RepID=A0A1Y1UKY5_9TREE|nr:putative glyoxal oxidase precursor [Kockovaella imperatae]ORX38711.1 putative glyoxal oxidase precursor [Kockovaella imperatae]